ncbi:phage tail terminator family protein [Bacillus sp. FSL K6-3431]|uniref:phage tail terminator family protein n=1 Tax=Bacillus sp. FSL K6-3431 TaxID=2921500 RepID=UPI0030FBBFBB
MEAELKTLIIQQIKEVYGTSMKVYDEPVRQGLQTPAFLVLIVEDEQERKLGSLSEWEYLINVTYFPEDDRNAYTENDRVSQTFKENFRYIGNTFHVNRLKATKSDGTLVISFTVKKLVKEIFKETKMEELHYGGVASE